MKKHMPGFVPVNFKNSGIILLLIGLLCITIKGISFFTRLFFAPNSVLYFGIAVLVLSLYLIFVVPKGNNRNGFFVALIFLVIVILILILTNNSLYQSKKKDKSLNNKDKETKEIHVRGNFSEEDIGQIINLLKKEKNVNKEDILSIIERDDNVEVMTGEVCGTLCGMGDEYFLEKINNKWTITGETKWVS